MTGLFSPDPAAVDWPTVRSLVISRGKWVLGAVAPQLRAQVAEEAGRFGLQVRVLRGTLVLSLQERRGRTAGPRLPR